MLPILVLTCCATAGGFAGPREAAIVAAMKLSEQPNYSWTTTVTDDARTYDIVGQTVRGGYTRVTMPAPNAVRRRLGRSLTDTQVEFIFRGNVACAIATEEGWRRPDDLPLSSATAAESGKRSRSAGAGGFPGVRTSRVGRGARPPLGGPAAKSGGEEERGRGYSNLQLGLGHPHEELAVIVSSHASLTVADSVVEGTLTDLGAQLLLVRDGQKEITPLRASGTFKLWLRGDAVYKYQVRLQGVLEVATSAGRRQVEVNQTSETVLREVGTTKFEVPDEAKAKLPP